MQGLGMAERLRRLRDRRFRELGVVCSRSYLPPHYHTGSTVWGFPIGAKRADMHVGTMTSLKETPAVFTGGAAAGYARVDFLMLGLVAVVMGVVT